MTDVFNLLDETFTTVGVRFLNEDEERFEYRERAKTYNYKVPRDWKLAVDDLLVVPATRTLRIVKIAEIHDEPQFNGLPNLRYAVGPVDMAAYIALNEREDKFRNALKAVERAKAKADVLDTLKTMASGSPAAMLLLGEALEMAGIAPPSEHATGTQNV